MIINPSTEERKEAIQKLRGSVIVMVLGGEAVRDSASREVCAVSGVAHTLGLT